MIRLCLLSLMSTLALAVAAETAREPSMDLLQDGAAKAAGHGEGHGKGHGKGDGDSHGEGQGKDHGKRHGGGPCKGDGKAHGDSHGKGGGEGHGKRHGGGSCEGGGKGHGGGHGQAGGEGHDEGHGEGESHGAGHGKELTIDLRQPLQMSPRMSERQLANMREHLQGIQAIVMALSVGDFEGVTQRALRMGGREGTRRMCQQFPGGGEGFMQMAMGFHDSADALAEAAKTHDTEAVIDALGQTLASCNACHSSYRQEIVQQP